MKKIFTIGAAFALAFAANVFAVENNDATSAPAGTETAAPAPEATTAAAPAKKMMKKHHRVKRHAKKMQHKNKKCMNGKMNNGNEPAKDADAASVPTDQEEAPAN